MDQRHALAKLDDESELSRLSAWLGAWEPCFSLHRPPRNEILYEPDGTLYAVSLGTPMTINLHHRERTIRPADVLVVPPALALEIEPEVDFLAVRCTGMVPDHFRERFIQVWGYDHFPSGLESNPPRPGIEEFREVIPATDLRFPCCAAIWQIPDTSAGPAARHTGHDLDLLLGIGDTVRVGIEETGVEEQIRGGRVLGIGPGLTYRLQGPGRLVVLRLTSTIIFETRRALDRARRGSGISPESVPGPSQPERS